MKSSFSIIERKPIWIALSEFYLDTELSESTFIYIAKTFKKSPYSLSEIKEIDKTEVFPVLQVNLLNVAGEWAGFDEDWLVETILDRLKKRNAFTKFLNTIYYKKFKWMNKEYWQKIEIMYKEVD